MLAALGATPVAELRLGASALSQIETVDLAPARERVAGVELVAASDVDNPLLGLRGSEQRLRRAEGRVARRHAATGQLPHQLRRADRSADSPTARAPDRPVVSASGWPCSAPPECPASAPSSTWSVSTRWSSGRRRRDWRGIVRPPIVAGQGGQRRGRGRHPPRAAHRGPRRAGRGRVGGKWPRSGVESAYSVVDLAGSVEAALDRPAERLTDLAARVARTWSRR